MTSALKQEIREQISSKNEYFYELPPELIAQRPVRPRDDAAMFVMHRSTGERELTQIKNLPDYLDAGDVVVINDTKVVPTVLRGVREHGGQIVIRLVSRKNENTWDCAVDTARPPSPGDRLVFGEGLIEATVLDRNPEGTGFLMSLRTPDGNLRQAIGKAAKYFHPLHLAPLRDGDEDILQTVYAEYEGSFQSPSAGLHITQRLLDALRGKGISVVEITQHVGRLDNPGPLAGDHVNDVETLYEEWFRVTDETARVINSAKETGNRVIAIGTTVTRTLETCATDDCRVKPGTGWSNLFLKPGSQFRIVDGLLSNFQSPKITTLILACAFAGTDEVMDFYNEAVRRGLRFLEYGDAALYL
ncbi:S-adenosylmethionine:tRNA ribosyltransferase-isomerase [Actinomyces ruminicola]|uniref:S-adenosylmethionine:tRNA ribosyltransferase-isomerase n=1 Tax=Actinomyces ruminicola TaxID=332524 RepID=UPI0011CACA71|nr:S-adenosylmethionine:tRNA ribosyltransferase-isomerase [Actinomyces ruminicola]